MRCGGVRAWWRGACKRMHARRHQEAAHAAARSGSGSSSRAAHALAKLTHAVVCPVSTYTTSAPGRRRAGRKIMRRPETGLQSRRRFAQSRRSIGRLVSSLHRPARPAADAAAIRAAAACGAHMPLRRAAVQGTYGGGQGARGQSKVQTPTRQGPSRANRSRAAGGGAANSPTRQSPEKGLSFSSSSHPHGPAIQSYIYRQQAPS
jgi:hypothetical protein